MPILIPPRRGPYTRKPPNEAKPDIGHPFFPDVFIPFNEGAGLPGAWINGVYRKPSSDNTGGTQAWEIHNGELHWRPATTAVNSWISWDQAPTAGTGRAYALTSLTRVVANGGFKYAVAAGSTSNYVPGYCAFNGVYPYSFFGTVRYSNATINAGDSCVVLGRRNDGQYAYCNTFKNRVQDGSPNPETFRNDNFTQATININNGRESGAQLNGQDTFAFNFFALWINPQWPDDDNLELYQREPERIWNFYSRPLPIWIPAAAGGGHTITSTLASLSLTAYDSTVNNKNEITSTLDSLTLTANASTVKVNAFVTSTLGSLTLTANNSTVKVNAFVTSTLGSLTLTPYASVVVEGGGGQNITSTLASLTLTPYASSINNKNEITATLDTLTLTPYATTVKVNAFVDSTLASLSLTSYASVITRPVHVTSTLASLSLTNYASAVTSAEPQAITSTLASLTLTAYPSTVVQKGWSQESAVSTTWTSESSASTTWTKEDGL